MREGRGGGELPGDVCLAEGEKPKLLPSETSDADFSEEGSSKVNLCECVYEATT